LKKLLPFFRFPFSFPNIVLSPPGKYSRCIAIIAVTEPKSPIKLAADPDKNKLNEIKLPSNEKNVIKMRRIKRTMPLVPSRLIAGNQDKKSAKGPLEIVIARSITTTRANDSMV
jgi:hypothetical protein